ncbi:MAG: hypothetical protein H7835_12505 [Magnetococcus sp. XQGC-1]
MINLFRFVFPPCWLFFRSAPCVLVVALFPSFAVAAEVPSEKELSTMGQGFGKFVGSFMRQMQSDEEKKSAVPDDRRVVERAPPPAGESAVRREPGGDSRRAEVGDRRYVPYRLYDPWGAARWGDPVLGFNPWGRGNSWVDQDWNARKWQYGWSYGGTSPWSGGHYGGDSYAGNPWGYSGGYPGGYGGERYPYSGGYAGDRYAAYGSVPSPRERSWSAPYGGDWGREERGPFYAEESPSWDDGSPWSYGARPSPGGKERRYGETR